MALSIIDPDTALVVIDLQKGLAGAAFLHPIAQVLARTCELTGAFRARGLPVVLVNVAGRAPGRTETPPASSGTIPPDFTDFLPELDPQPGDMIVTKRTWGAFANTDLETRLKARGVTQVVLVGVATSIGVEATARQAYEAGFNVTLAADAMTDTRAQGHDYSIHTVFPRLGEVGSSAEVIALLPGRGN
ncbi:MAG: isochorismatase family protein [Acetobacter sp.]|uniref:isochorismatase family protein n=1 Tax=Acetobacter sp. TaxID=440 RepID=UPI0039E92377